MCLCTKEKKMTSLLNELENAALLQLDKLENVSASGWVDMRKSCLQGLCTNTHDLV
jgi:hypothetical protein